MMEAGRVRAEVTGKNLPSSSCHPERGREARLEGPHHDLWSMNARLVAAVTGIESPQRCLILLVANLSWRCALPVVQLAAALAALLYAPYQYRARPHAIFDDSGLVAFQRNWPPPVLRILYAVNFPGLAVAIPVRYARWSDVPLVHRQEPFIWLSVEDTVFLIGVVVLWYWLGTMLDRRLGCRGIRQRSKLITIIGLMIGCLLSLGLGALAVYFTLLTDVLKPYKQIGPFGVMWSALLLFCFARRLRTDLQTSVHRGSG